MAEVTTETLPVRWKQEFEQYATRKYNLLVPRELGAVPAYHTPQMAVVQIDTEEKSGETYRLPGGKFALSKVALDRISQAGDITWMPELSGRTDDGSNPRKIAYRAVGKVKNLSGQWRTIMGEKELDLDVIAEELRQSLPKRWERMERKPSIGFEAWFKQTLAEDLLQFKKHMLGRAESGAKNRAIRSAFAIRSGYTIEELKNPFVIPKLIFTPDFSDPDVKRFMLAEATGTIRELYGASAVPTGQIPPALPPASDEPDADPISGESAPTEPPPPASGTTEQPPPQTAHYGDHTPAPDPDEVRFQEAAGDAKKEQEALLRLIGRKGYDTGRIKKPLDKFDKGERLGFLKHLLHMADVKPPELPWS